MNPIEQKAAAQRLADQWRAREIEMRATIPDPDTARALHRHGYRGELAGITRTVTSPRSAAIERCRRELESAFNLNPTSR